MGTRINYEIGDAPSVILYSNSHHSAECPEDVFRALVAKHAHSYTDLTRALLGVRYLSASGQHQVGDPMFTVDLEPGDREKVLRVSFTNGGAKIKELAPDYETDLARAVREREKLRSQLINLQVEIGQLIPPAEGERANDPMIERVRRLAAENENLKRALLSPGADDEVRGPEH